MGELLRVGLVGAVLVCAWIDARTGRIPNAIVYPALAVLAVQSVHAPVIAVAALLAGLPYLAAFHRGSGGGGDVKLAAVCGGVVGAPVLSLLLVAGAAVLTLVTLAVRRTTRCRHGPMLAAMTGALWAVTDLA